MTNPFFKAIAQLRHDVIHALGVSSRIVIADVSVTCYTKRVDSPVSGVAYAALDLGTPYQVTLAPNALAIELVQQAIKLQQRRIYPLLYTTDNNDPRLFVIDEYLTLADGCVAINGYTLRVKPKQA